MKRADPFGPIPLSERTNEVIYIGRTHSVRESISKFYCFKATFPELTSAVTRCYNLMSLRVVKSGLEVLPEAIGDLARHGLGDEAPISDGILRCKTKFSCRHRRMVE